MARPWLQQAAPPLHPENTATYHKLGIVLAEAAALPAALHALWEASQRAVAGGAAARFAAACAHAAAAYAEVGLFREALAWARKAAAVAAEGTPAAARAAASVALYAARAVDFQRAQNAAGARAALPALTEPLPTDKKQ
jgi:hypothetical protein